MSDGGDKVPESLDDSIYDSVNSSIAGSLDDVPDESSRDSIINDTIMPADEETTSRVPRVKLPPFIPDDPDLWFAQVDWALTNAGMKTSTEKFQYVGTSLEHRYAKEVRDIILKPPKEEDDPFKTLKDELLHRLGKSQAQRTRQLLEREEIGARTPSQFLRHLQQLAGETAAQDIVRALWMDRLDPITRAGIAAQPTTASLDDLARIADNIADSISNLHPASATPQIAQVTATAMPNESRLLEQLTRLQLQLAEMQCDHRREIAAVRSELQDSRRSRSTYRDESPDGDRDHRRRSPSQRGRSRSRPSVQYDGMCWYHFKFGDEARKCKTPCRLNASFIARQPPGN